MMRGEGKRNFVINGLRKIRHYHSVLGVAGVAAFLLSKLSDVKPVFKANFPGIRHSVYVRVGTTDISVCKQVLIERHYDCPLSIMPEVIIDAGANIGLSAVYFANRYPNSTIFALEPDESNFKMLERNASAYPQIKPLKVALWMKCGRICLVDPGTGNAGFQTVEAVADSSPDRTFVEAITLDTLMNRIGLGSIDILKMDIEGAEKEVFENSENWVGKVEVIMAELHDDIKAGCSNALSQATQGFQGRFSNGEIVMRLRSTTFS